MLRKIASPKWARKVEVSIMVCSKTLRGSHGLTWQTHDSNKITNRYLRMVTGLLNKIASPKWVRKVEVSIMVCSKTLRGSHGLTKETHDSN